MYCLTLKKDNFTILQCLQLLKKLSSNLAKTQSDFRAQKSGVSKITDQNVLSGMLCLPWPPPGATSNILHAVSLTLSPALVGSFL